MGPRFLLGIIFAAVIGCNRSDAPLELSRSNIGDFADSYRRAQSCREVANSFVDHYLSDSQLFQARGTGARRGEDPCGHNNLREVCYSGFDFSGYNRAESDRYDYGEYDANPNYRSAPSVVSHNSDYYFDFRSIMGQFSVTSHTVSWLLSDGGTAPQGYIDSGLLNIDENLLLQYTIAKDSDTARIYSTQTSEFVSFLSPKEKYKIAAVSQKHLVMHQETVIGDHPLISIAASASSIHEKYKSNPLGFYTITQSEQETIANGLFAASLARTETLQKSIDLDCTNTFVPNGPLGGAYFSIYRYEVFSIENGEFEKINSFFVVGSSFLNTIVGNNMLNWSFDWAGRRFGQLLQFDLVAPNGNIDAVHRIEGEGIGFLTKNREAAFFSTGNFSSNGKTIAKTSVLDQTISYGSGSIAQLNYLVDTGAPIDGYQFLPTRDSIGVLDINKSQYVEVLPINNLVYFLPLPRDNSIISVQLSDEEYDYEVAGFKVVLSKSRAPIDSQQIVGTYDYNFKNEEIYNYLWCWRCIKFVPEWDLLVVPYVTKNSKPSKVSAQVYEYKFGIMGFEIDRLSNAISIKFETPLGTRKCYDYDERQCEQVGFRGPIRPPVVDPNSDTMVILGQLGMVWLSRSGELLNFEAYDD